MKRLLIFSRCHQPRGGADRIVVDLCRNLPQLGWDVTLGLTEGYRFDNPDNYLRTYGELPVHRIDGTLGTREFRLRSITRAIRKVAPDIVLSMRVFDVYEAVARLKQSRRKGPRLAVGIRAFESPYLADLRRWRRHVDLVVTSGEFIKSTCERWCEVESERVVSIGGGVHAPMNPPAPREARSPLRILYAGRLDYEQKRAQDLIPFVRELRKNEIPFELLIAGAGTAEPELKEHLGCLNNVRFLGWLEREALYQDIFPQSDILIHFAEWEGVTIAPREAMIHGVVPVISRFVGYQQEGQFVDEKTALTFQVGDINTAVVQVRRLLEEHGLMERLSREAMESQAGKYSFQGSMDAWVASLNRSLMMPVMSSVDIPQTPERMTGRLSALRIPVGVQSQVRRLLGLRVRHESPGSEWPTASGLLTSEEEQEIQQLSQAPYVFSQVNS